MLFLGNNCRFVPVFRKECPLYPQLPECSSSNYFSNGELCEAKGPLPDGYNTDYNVNNCDFGMHGVYDVFKCVKSKCLD